MTKGLISVIIPVYNTEKYLERCIGSVLDNTYKNLEIICVNDGSPDNSLQILNHFATLDNRIKVVCKENGGLSDTRNYGMNIATGEYLYFLDSDDWIHKDTFSILMDAAGKTQAAIIVGGRIKVYRDNTSARCDEISPPVTQIVSTEKAQRNGELRSFVTGRLYRRSFVGSLTFVDSQHAEDTIFNARLMSSYEDMQIAFIDYPLYYYYQGRGDSLVASNTLDTYIIQSKWLLDNIALFPKTDYALAHAFRGAFLYRYFCMFCANTTVAKKNTRVLLQKCLFHLHNNHTIPLITRLSLYLFSKSSNLYRLSLLIRDPSYKRWESVLKEKYGDVTVHPWEELRNDS